MGRGIVLFCIVASLGAQVLYADTFLDGSSEPTRPVLTSCSVCPPGYGAVSLCDGTRDTVCKECVRGTFSDRYTADGTCLPCSECPKGMYDFTPCISIQDVRCEPCYNNGGGFGNENFLRKCETTTVKTTTTTTTTTTPPPTTTTTTTVAPSTIEVQEPEVTTEDVLSEITTEVATEESSGDEDDRVLIVENPVATEPDDDLLIPVKVERTTTEKPKPEPVIDVTEEVGIDVVNIREEPQVGEKRDKEPEPVKTGGFQWPILVAVVVSAIVCFILGLLLSACIHKRSNRGKYSESNPYEKPPVEAFENLLSKPNSSQNASLIRYHREDDVVTYDGKSP